MAPLGRVVSMTIPEAYRRLIMACALVPFLWASASAAPDSSGSDLRIHARGIGQLTIGMTVKEAQDLPGVELEQTGPDPEADTFCTYYKIRLAGQEIRARIIKGEIERLEVSTPGIKTLSGIAVGDSIERVRKVYGNKIAVERHHYRWDQGVVLMVLGPFGKQTDPYGVSFTASPENGVTEMWVGRYRGIRESEGCM
jgi:hypothetical protein